MRDGAEVLFDRNTGLRRRCMKAPRNSRKREALSRPLKVRHRKSPLGVTAEMALMAWRWPPVGSTGVCPRGAQVRPGGASERRPAPPFASAFSHLYMAVREKP